MLVSNFFETAKSTKYLEIIMLSSLKSMTSLKSAGGAVSSKVRLLEKKLTVKTKPLAADDISVFSFDVDSIDSESVMEEDTIETPVEPELTAKQIKDRKELDKLLGMLEMAKRNNAAMDRHLQREHEGLERARQLDRELASINRRINERREERKALFMAMGKDIIAPF